MTERQITVLRLGHRIERDKRVTMHVFLTARALSASGVVYSGQRDRDLERGIRDVVSQWGGPFEVKYERNWKKLLQNWQEKDIICHLTMYGININKCLDQIPRDKPILVIVGSQKVHKDVYQLADYNIAIGNQPHSEVAALAIFLDRLHKGKELKNRFEKSKMRIVPQERGKEVIFESQ
jgi:tRNA (cytidine56-2'-O)-methyltransferase